MTQGFDLDEIERLLAAATPGEWDWTDFPEITVDGVTAIIDCSAGDSEDENVANAQLIVAAKNSAPAMIAEIRALRAENARLRGKLAWYAEQLCELGTSHDCCGRMASDDCAGCLARAALTGEPQ